MARSERKNLLTVLGACNYQLCLSDLRLLLPGDGGEGGGVLEEVVAVTELKSQILRQHFT